MGLKARSQYLVQFFKLVLPYFYLFEFILTDQQKNNMSKNQNFLFNNKCIVKIMDFPKDHFVKCSGVQLLLLQPNI